MKTLIKILPIMLMTAGQAAAQAPMGIRECMQYAVENSTKIAVEDERQSQNTINRRDAWLNAFTPSVSASSGVSYSSGRIPDPETNMYSTLTTIQDSYQLYGSTLFTLIDTNRMKYYGKKVLPWKFCLADFKSFTGSVEVYNHVVNKYCEIRNINKNIELDKLIAIKALYNIHYRRKKRFLHGLKNLLT